MRMFGPFLKLLLLAMAAAAVPAAAATSSCASLSDFKSATVKVTHAEAMKGSLPPADLTPARGASKGKVNPELLDLPAFCRVFAILSPVPGSRIEMELWLPQKWNSKLLGIGSHGFGGNFEHGDMAMGMLRGYAVATSDMGHSSRISETQAGFNVGDARFAMGNPVAVEDFAWRSTHEMTVAAKALVLAFYGVPHKLAYFEGCSNGGRQAMREAQQFPADYDGIIAGSAAMNWTGSFAATLLYFKAGFLPSGGQLKPEKLQIAQAAAVAACDKLDGLADGLISDPSRCHWRASSIVCPPGSNSADCLTAEEAAAIDRMYEPLIDSATGKQAYPGLEPGGETMWRNMTGFNAVSSNFYRYVVYEDAKWTPDANVDVMDALHRSQLAGSAGLSIDSINPDLSAFRARGGKLIQYHGWTDPSFAGRFSPDYYAEVVDLQPDADKLAATQKFYRLFMSPAMAHCYGGYGPINFGALDHVAAPTRTADNDVLEALDRWVEKKVAPKALVATEFTDTGAVKRQMPLCAYPQVAAYTKGDPMSAQSYRCATPPK